MTSMPTRPTFEWSLLALAAASCTPPAAAPLGPSLAPTSRPRVSAPATPCSEGHAERERVKGLLAQGKLDRVVRVIEHADTLCPSHRGESDTALASTLAELQSGPEDGPALIAAGLVAKSRGNGAEAQRLFDRGVARLEKAAGKRATVEFPDGLTQPVSEVGWSEANGISILQGNVLTFVDPATLRERERRTSPTIDPTTKTYLSADGTTRATVSGNAVRVSSTASNKTLGTLVGTKGEEVDFVAFSPDGKRLVAVQQTTIHLWDVAGAKEVEKLRREGDRFFCGFQSAILSPDGKKIATVESERQGGSGNAPCWAIGVVWDLSTRAQLSRFQGSTGTHVRSIAFSPDGAKVVSASVGDPSFAADEVTVNVWDAATGQELVAMKRHTLPLDSVSVSPDGLTLAVSAFESGSCAQQKVHSWSGAAGQGVVEFDGRSPLSFSPDGKRLQAGQCSITTQGDSALFDVATGRALAKLRGDWQLFPVAPKAHHGSTASLSSPTKAREIVLTRTADSARLATVRFVAGSKSAYVTTPDGYFDMAGDAARKIASCRIGSLSFPIDVCEERYSVPGLLAEIMAGDSAYMEP